MCVCVCVRETCDQQLFIAVPIQCLNKTKDVQYVYIINKCVKRIKCIETELKLEPLRHVSAVFEKRPGNHTW